MEPFSSRRDARKAEAIAIHVAAMAGVSVRTDNDEDIVLTNTNIAGMRSTKELGPAIFTREGEIHSRNLTKCVIVPISANALEGRPAPFGGHGGAFFADRARKHWNIAVSKRQRITRLLAILKGGKNIILGDWDVDPLADWILASADSTRVAVPLINPEVDDPRGDKGKRLLEHRLNSGVTYSPDLK